LDLDTPVDDTKGGAGSDEWLLCFTKVAHIAWPKHTNNQDGLLDSDTPSDDLKGRTRSGGMFRLPHRVVGGPLANVPFTEVPFPHRKLADSVLHHDHRFTAFYPAEIPREIQHGQQTPLGSFTQN
jgi:hypothetical protein